jgi:hypothetical protein
MIADQKEFGREYTRKNAKKETKGKDDSRTLAFAVDLPLICLLLRASAAEQPLAL